MAAQWHEKTDEELLALIGQQHHLAFATLVRRHTQRFYAVAYRHLLTKTDAEDVVQDAFLKLWQNPKLYQAERGAKFTTWFYQIILNACVDVNKKKKPLALPEDFDVADARPTALDDLVEKEESQQVKEALAGLPEQQRMAMNLCFYEALSNEEAANIMGIHLKALQSLLMRAKTTLKDKMQKTRKEFRHAS